MKFQIILFFLCACLVAVFAVNNPQTHKDRRDKRQLLPFGYGYPYYASYPYGAYPYGYAPYSAYATYGAYASPFTYPGVAATIVTAPFGYFR